MDLYSAFIVVPHTQGVQVRITQCYKLQRTCLYFVSVHQMTPPQTEGCGHLIAAYYSFIYPEMSLKVIQVSK